jgi:hypothetical protein
VLIVSKGSQPSQVAMAIALAPTPVAAVQMWPSVAALPPGEPLFGRLIGGSNVGAGRLPRSLPTSAIYLLRRSRHRRVRGFFRGALVLQDEFTHVSIDSAILTFAGTVLIVRIYLVLDRFFSSRREH